MKKRYIAPREEVMNFLPEQMMTLSVGDGTTGDGTGESTGDNFTKKKEKNSIWEYKQWGDNK